ncbi:nuclear transport factor 2 family protein [Achromobacter sp. UMC46]|uniref:nuclear transport factor 2 family protein n=1 Tax=Achromobacter sp. UMC46 TaxID=1862319 RepID=UPI001601E40D|nr:nuclear transport factor 2 family protein [Achromobacter sp. UMC46]
MEHSTRTQQVKAACEAVILDFFHALDTRRHEAASALMAADGVWLRQGKRLCGPQEVLAALNVRPPERVTCHIITNLRLTGVEGPRASVAYFLTAYESVPQEQGGAPRLVSIRECQDELVEAGSGWRLADKRSRRHLPPE